MFAFSSGGVYHRLNYNCKFGIMVTGKGMSFTDRASRPAVPAMQPRAVRSHELFMGAREIHIAHGEEVYRLTVTRQGKLILTK